MTVATLLLAAAMSVQSAGTTRIVIVTGVGGDPAYRESFPRMATDFAHALVDKHGVDPAAISFLEGDAGSIAGATRATGENVARVLGDVARNLGAGDRLVIFYIGHGSSRGDQSLMNIPGPDMSGDDLNGVLEAIDRAQVVFINTSSSSGQFVAALSKPGRIVITATSSQREANLTSFPEYFIAAYSGAQADLDKDNRISLLEAFAYANREVERQFGSGGRLRTEHAMLDDNGDGVGSREPDPLQGDGASARRFFFDASGPAVLAGPVSDDPELAALYGEKDRIESAIENLRTIRSQVDPDEYDDRLETLVLDLANTTAAIREREGGAN